MFCQHRLYAMTLVSTLGCLLLACAAVWADDDSPPLTTSADPSAADVAEETEGASTLWSHDVESAQKDAAKSDKILLMNFTGSDWCAYCILLEKEVFQHAEFAKWCEGKAIAVEFDYPSDPDSLPAETRKQNDEWLRKFSVQGFPTIFLCDAAGRPFAQTGYQKGGVGPYLEHLDELLKLKSLRDESFAKADKATGRERAEHLHAALSCLPDQLAARHYAETIEEIKKLGGDDLARKYAQLPQVAGGNAEEREEWMADPFGFLGADMSSAADDLGQQETKEPVEETHPRIEERLAKLIEMLEKSGRESGSGGGNKNPSNPAEKSTLRSGKGEIGELLDPDKSDRKWAKIPPKEREKILRSRDEGFPAEFGDVLADYYRRLAEEKNRDKDAK